MFVFVSFVTEDWFPVGLRALLNEFFHRRHNLLNGCFAAKSVAVLIPASESLIVFAMGEC